VNAEFYTELSASHIGVELKKWECFWYPISAYWLVKQILWWDGDKKSTEWKNECKPMASL